MSSIAARFHLISGNRLDALAARLGERLAAAPAGVDLRPETILIPQPALRHWLLHTLAERYGVAANFDIRTPSEFVWGLLRATHAALPAASPWDRERLRWPLYALLSGPGAALPAVVRQHLRRATADAAAAGTASARIGETDATATRAALARFALADDLAAAFDRYQAYRREWLDAWERGEDAGDWQAALWRALRRRLGDTPHRAALIGQWLTRHDRRRDPQALAPPGLPPRLAAFGTLHVSPDTLRMLAVAAQWSAVDFYLPTPSAEYWGDVESLRARLHRDGPDALPAALADAQADNPLLAAWGAGGRDIVAQLFSYEIVEPQAEHECFVAPGRDSLLRRLQQDVLDRAAPRAEGALPEADASVQVHACHSRLREVEVLHDRLRAMLDPASPEGRVFDPPLRPREIAVMAPDIGAYLPLVRAVFGGFEPDDPRYIPFSLADRPQSQSHPLVGVFLGLLDLADTPLRAGAFRDLLAVPAIAQAQGLDAEDLARIDAWFEAAGIRWGEDAEARVRAGVGRWREYSFEFGFDRLLAGYAAGEGVDLLVAADAHAHDDPDNRDDDTRVSGADRETEFVVAPYPELEGGDAERLDRALAVYETLRDFAAWMRAPQSAADWQLRLAQTFLGLLAPIAQDAAEAQARQRVLDALDEFAADAADAAVALPAVVVRQTLHERLLQPPRQQPWLAGGVTFAGMVPLRTVPFRAICLLGLDADAFPRREPGGDVQRLVDALQGRAPRKLGDRSVREDDRFLFLQLLCAAGDAFYLSYGGRDARDGSLREPAAPIGDLLDTVERMHGPAARARLCLEHPLQPFSPRAFGGGEDAARDSRRFSYRHEWRMPDVERAREHAIEYDSEHDRVHDRADAARPGAERESGDAFALRPLPSADAPPPPDRDALQRFYANPAQIWLRDRLGLRLDRDGGADDPDREPLGADALTRYRAADALLRDPDIGSGADAPGDDGEADVATASDAAVLTRRLRAQALLPPGRDGDAMAVEAAATAMRLRAAAAALRGDAAPRTVEATATGANTAETGTIAFRFDDVGIDREGAPLRIVATPGAANGKRLLRAGIDHLLLASVLGGDAVTCLLSDDRKAGRVHGLRFRGVERDAAQAALARLLHWWRVGQHAPLPFAPKAAWAYAEALSEHGDAQRAWSTARQTFAPTFSAFDAEADDPWLRLAFRPGGLFEAFAAAPARGFRDIAEDVCLPLLRCLDEAAV